MVRMDTLKKQRQRYQCPELWSDARLQTVEVCWIHSHNKMAIETLGNTFVS